MKRNLRTLETYSLAFIFSAGLLINNPAMAYCSETGFGIQTNLPINLSGGGGALDIAKDSILHPQGSTTITNKNIGYEKEQETRATIGEGKIIINGEEAAEEELKELNRDLDNTQEITKDVKTGGLDAEITINDKWITDPLGQFKNIGYIFEEGWDLTSSAAKKLWEGVEYVWHLAIPEDVRVEIANRPNIVCRLQIIYG